MIEIVVGVDYKQDKYLWALLNSLEKNSGDKFIHVHICVNEVDGKMPRTKLLQNVTFKNLMYSIHDVTDTLKDVKWKSRTWTKTCLVPLIVGDVVYDNRAIYMDLDMLVLKPLDELWDTKMDHSLMMCKEVRNMTAVNRAVIPKLDGREDTDFDYFNSGMIVYDLTDNTRLKLNHIFENIDLVTTRYVDQDAINAEFKNDIQEMSNKYNYWSRGEIGSPYKATVIHYASASRKPLRRKNSDRQATKIYIPYYTEIINLLGIEPEYYD